MGLIGQLLWSVECLGSEKQACSVNEVLVIQRRIKWRRMRTCGYTSTLGSDEKMRVSSLGSSGNGCADRPNLLQVSRKTRYIGFVSTLIQKLS